MTALPLQHEACCHTPTERLWTSRCFTEAVLTYGFIFNALMAAATCKVCQAQRNPVLRAPGAPSTVSVAGQAHSWCWWQPWQLHSQWYLCHANTHFYSMTHVSTSHQMVSTALCNGQKTTLNQPSKAAPIAETIYKTLKTQMRAILQAHSQCPRSADTEDTSVFFILISRFK